MGVQQMFKNHVFALGFESYSEYLFSCLWRSKSDQMINIKKVCELCGNNKSLQVHHKTYENVGNEKQRDLQVLCRSCHEEVHK